MNTKSILYTLGMAAMLIVSPFQYSLHAQMAFAGAATPSFQSGTEMVMASGYTPAVNSDRIPLATIAAPSAGRDPDYMGDIGLINLIVNELANRASAANVVNFGSARIVFRKTSFNYPFNPNKEIGITEFTMDQLLPYALAAKQYAIANGLDTSYAFLVNMGVLSDRKRFFIVNLSTLEIEYAGLAAQGRGLGPTRFAKQYSNALQSRCTSLGRYKIASKYSGEYGNAYRLAGLDTTNSNAMKRNIVLHAMGCLPDEEQPNTPVCITEGCPGVSVNFLNTISGIIDNRKKPVMMWLFDSNLEDATIERIVAPVQEPAAPAPPRHRCPIHQEPEDPNLGR